MGLDEQLASIMPMNQNSNPKELFDSNDIEVKSELTAEQVIILTRLELISERIKRKYQTKIIDTVINKFLKFQISKDRQSRTEFVNAFQSKNDEKMGGLMDKFNLSLGK